MTCFWYTVFDGDNSKEELKMKWKGRWHIGGHEELDEQNRRIRPPAAFYLRRDGVEYDLGLSTI